MHKAELPIGVIILDQTKGLMTTGTDGGTGYKLSGAGYGTVLLRK
jgi:hypothetical protein